MASIFGVRWAIEAIKIHHLVPGRNEVMDELFLPVGTSVDFHQRAIELYEKLGFRKIGLLHQHQGSDFRVSPIEPPPGEHLRTLEPADTARAIELASRASGLDRSALLPALLDISQGVALVGGERNDKVLGFALLRPFGRGHAIGPVAVASDDGRQMQRAQALIANRLVANAGEFTRIDTPDEQGLGPWLESIGLPRVDTVVKMARNGELPRDADVLQFAIVNQALG